MHPIIDAHLDLSWNALSWNRDLTQPLASSRKSESAMGDHPARGRGTVALPEMAIVETKTAARVSQADRLLWRSGRRPTQISKYGTGLAALRPELPSTKWHRILRRHFPAAA